MTKYRTEMQIYRNCWILTLSLWGMTAFFLLLAYLIANFFSFFLGGLAFLFFTGASVLTLILGIKGIIKLFNRNYKVNEEDFVNKVVLNACKMGSEIATEGMRRGTIAGLNLRH